MNSTTHATYSKTTMEISELEIIRILLDNKKIALQEKQKAKKEIQDILDQNRLEEISPWEVFSQMKILLAPQSSAAFAEETHKAGAPANQPLDNLHLAARNGLLKEVKQLIALGKNVNQGDFFGTTPLHMAAMYGHKHIVNYLLKMGANINAYTYIDHGKKHAFTPFDLALKFSPNSDTVVTLLNHGADSLSWPQSIWFPVEESRKAASANDYDKFNLLLSKLDAIIDKDPSLVFTSLTKEDPFGSLLQIEAAKMKSPQFHARYMETVKLVLSADTLHYTDKFITAKHLMLTFPITAKTYKMQIGSHQKIVDVDGGFFALFTTDLARRSLAAYTETLGKENDIPGFRQIQAQLRVARKLNTQTLEQYTQLKKSIFNEVFEIFKFSTAAAKKPSLYETSQQIYQQFEAGKTVLLPSGWNRHHLDIILDKHLNLLIVANGGNRNPALKSGANAYTMNFKITVDDIYEILNNTDQMDLEFKQFYDLGLVENTTFSFEVTPQKFLNCTWYSHQIAEKALLFLALQKKIDNPDFAKELSHYWFDQLNDFHQTYILKEYLAAPTLETDALSDILINYHGKLTTQPAKERAILILDNLTNENNTNQFQQYYQSHKKEFTPELVHFMKDNGYDVIFHQDDHSAYQPIHPALSDVIVEVDHHDPLKALHSDPPAHLNEVIPTSQNPLPLPLQNTSEIHLIQEDHNVTGMI
ncbi:MAG: ankyrin repeat domain-containing protein [Candidatus Berkiellales bacterium]